LVETKPVLGAVFVGRNQKKGGIMVQKGRDFCALVVLVGIIGLVGWGAAPAVAQTFSAAISGLVRDTSGAVIPGVTVTAKQTESGLTRTVLTNENGDYRMPSLPVGAYEVMAEIPGFKPLVRTGIELAVAQEVVLNLTLEVGTTAEQVTVTGEAPLVNATLSSTAGLITGEQLKDLPLNGRSFHELMTLNTHTADNRSNSGGASFSVAGKRTENNRWTVNGVDYVGDNATGQFIAPTGISGAVARSRSDTGIQRPRAQLWR